MRSQVTSASHTFRNALINLGMLLAIAVISTACGVDWDDDPAASEEETAVLPQDIKIATPSWQTVCINSLGLRSAQSPSDVAGAAYGMDEGSVDCLGQPPLRWDGDLNATLNYILSFSGAQQRFLLIVGRASGTGERYAGGTTFPKANSVANSTVIASTPLQGQTVADLTAWVLENIPGPQTVRLARVGSGIIQSTQDVAKQSTCPSPHLVKRVATEWVSSPTAITLVSKLQLTCTDGTTMTFGYPGGSVASQTCSNGNLISGLAFKAGQFIDAVGWMCRDIKSTKAAVLSGPWGGSGGTRKDANCPPGKFVVGAKVYSDGPGESRRRVLGVEVICR